MEEQNKIVIYQTEDGKTQIDVKFENETVWLTQAQMATLFEKDQSVIARHINNAVKEGEIDPESNMQFLHNTQYKYRPTRIYNLDVIITVGYRVHSQRGVQFRRWATRVLKDYLIKGYAVNTRIQHENFVQLQQLVNAMSRTIKLNQLNDEASNALLDVVVDYANALDRLDDYDYQRLTIPENTTSEEKFHATYEGAMQVLSELREKFGGSSLLPMRRTTRSRAPSGRSTRPLVVRTSTHRWRRRLPCFSTW